MSKSMAIEAIMKVFLMIAVIIVGMSFLLKAFGIDLFGWLENLVSGLGIPKDGKALHIKADPGRNDRGGTGDVWEFHLLSDVEAQKHDSDDKIRGALGTIDIHPYFFPGKLLQKKCVIFSQEERFVTNDAGAFYYVNPGGMIQEGCDSVESCLSKNLESRKCEAWEVRANRGDKCDLCKKSYDPNAGTEGNCAGEFHFVNCAGGSWLKQACLDNDKVIQIPFSDDTHIADYCVEHKKECSNLLQEPEKAKDGIWGYSIKFGLICDNSGKWQVCKETGVQRSASITISSGSDAGTYKCEPEAGGEFYVWRKQ